MKRYSHIAFWALMVPAFMATGCSLLKPIQKNNVGKEVVLPSDRESLHSSAKQDRYTSTDIAKGIIKGDWTITEVAGKPAIGEKIPYLRFEPSEKRVYGNDGCNVLNASYICNPADSTIRFDNLMSTMMACGAEGITDAEIKVALADTRRYIWNLEGHDYHITLLDEAGQPLMSMVHCNFEFLNGSWHVVAIEGEPVNVEGMDLVIDIDEGKLHGNTGCNIMNGKVETDLDTPNSISFSAIATTRMMCPDIESETRLVVALEEACSARALTPDKVELLGTNRQPVITLERISL